MRLGILGGTFDPVHFGHLRLALEVAENLDLDCLSLVPASVPPHKGEGAVASFADRYEMIRMALGDTPVLDVLDLEGRREGPSYTVWTLREIRQSHACDLDLYFVVGTDAFWEIRTWKDYRTLFDYAHFVLVERPGGTARDVERLLESLDLGFIKAGPREYRMGAAGNTLIRMETTALDISSTRIREAAAQGRSIRFLLPDSVEAYIMERGLYSRR